MKKYDIDVNINGKVTFEVVAENITKAKEMVNDLLNNSKFKELMEQGKFNVHLTKNIEKGKER